MAKKLKRSGKNKMIAGVCGGLGKFFDVDPTIIRVIWVLLTLFTAFFGGIIAYIICWAVIPED